MVRTADGETFHTCSIVTGPAGPRMMGIHDRQPITLDGDGLDVWLNRRVSDVDRLMTLLEPCSEELLDWYEVDTIVENV